MKSANIDLNWFPLNDIRLILRKNVILKVSCGLNSEWGHFSYENCFQILKYMNFSEKFLHSEFERHATLRITFIRGIMGFLNHFAGDKLKQFLTIGVKVQKTAVLKNSKKAQKITKWAPTSKNFKNFFRQLEQTNDEFLLGLKSTFIST